MGDPSHVNPRGPTPFTDPFQETPEIPKFSEKLEVMLRCAD